ncbi:NAC domain containing 69-like protein isoform 1 [Hibiscus syriacus]|uniref:NAC domain containing 69-like protein isoform 1 n=1 Tax=Hibiscus syriacus TaxID=106335 RepID=A0A6A3AWB0_HIBSY|nr:NAC domain containing 69-like protein isoform 1 [Hibiscus syriacus]
MNIDLDIGFRFLPPDEQIISFFLKNKMIGDHKSTRHIREVDLLKHEPWELPALSLVQSTYQEWLFFYKLNKISEKKMGRLTNSGFWKSTGADRPVSNGGAQIGTKKTLVFHRGRTPRGVKTDWIMHEFRANPDFLPHNALSMALFTLIPFNVTGVDEDHNNHYVVGYLRRNAAEKTENSVSNVGQTSAHFAASSTPKDAAGFTSMEVVRQPQSDSMDYEMALQMQMEDEGIFASDLSPSMGSHDLPPTSVDNGQIVIEEGISFEDLDFLQSDALVDEEQNEWQLQFDPIEEEREFMDSLFNNQEEHSNVEAEHIYSLDYRATDYAGDRHDTDPKWDNAWTQSEANGNWCSSRQILIMDSRVESATVTAYEINCLESVKEERSVISRACKSESKPRSHKLVAQGHTRRVQLQGKSSGKAVSRDKARESGVHTPVVQPVQNKKSVVQANKSLEMDWDWNTKLISNSRSEGSAGSSRKNSFNFVEMSQLRSKPNPPLVYVRNVIVGAMLFIFVVWEVMFIR